MLNPDRAPVNRRPPTSQLSARIDAALAAEFRAFIRDQRGAPLYESTASFLKAAITAQLAVVRQRLAGLAPGHGAQVQPPRPA